MRQPGRFNLMMMVVLLASTLAFSGCAWRSSAQRSKPTAALQTVQGDLEYAQLQVRETMEALDELVVVHEKDLEQAFRRFSDRADKVTAVGERLVRHADGMQLRGSSYLVEPEQSTTECRFPRLSDTAGTKPLEIGGAFYPIADGAGYAKRSYREFESDITKIRDLLSRQLNRATLESANAFIRKARVDGESLNHALQQSLFATQDAKTARTEAAPAGGAIR